MAQQLEAFVANKIVDVAARSDAEIIGAKNLATLSLGGAGEDASPESPRHH